MFNYCVVPKPGKQSRNPKLQASMEALHCPSAIGRDYFPRKSSIRLRGLSLLAFLALSICPAAAQTQVELVAL
ncbi:MAG TPA: hypothetical protein VK629_01835, partial [Steroidobacteraceae bacterium]|nr:hypothetical protein [Steroidobacteraceae bacterium]